MKYKFNIKNLDCVNCVREVEESLNEDKKINKAVVNFNTSTITVETDVDDAFSYVKETVAMIEPDAILSEEKIESDKYNLSKNVYNKKKQHFNHGITLGVGYGVWNQKPDLFIGYSVMYSF